MLLRKSLRNSSFLETSVRARISLSVLHHPLRNITIVQPQGSSDGENCNTSQSLPNVFSFGSRWPSKLPESVDINFYKNSNVFLPSNQINRK